MLMSNSKDAYKCTKNKQKNCLCHTNKFYDSTPFDEKYNKTQKLS